MSSHVLPMGHVWRCCGKHRYVLFSGVCRTKRLLRLALRWKVTEHTSDNAESE